MVRTSGRILKSEHVQLEGQYRLDVSQAGFSKTGALPAGAEGVARQARVVENHPQYAIIEVTCSCGGKMLVRCEYAAAQPPDKQQAKNDTPAVSNKTK